MLRARKEIAGSPLPEASRLFYVIDFTLKLLFPLCSVICEYMITATPVDPDLIAKWFIFWGLGICFLVKGIIQLAIPRFAAFNSNHLTKSKNNEIVKQLGILNISIGALGVFSLFNEQARQTAAFTAVVYSGLTTLWHFFRKADPVYEIISLATDLLLFSTSLLFFVFYSIL